MVKKQANPHESLDKVLQGLAENTKSKPITLETFIHSLAGKGYPILAVILALPFCQPLQIPGVSFPFGILLIFVGLRMAFGHRLWWPQWILKKEISPKTVKLIAQKSQWILKKLYKILHPRVTYMSEGPVMHVLNGLAIAVMGLFLSLPLPIPLSNIIAAWSIMLIGLGIIGNDGLFIAAGYILAVFSIAALIFILVLARHLFASWSMA